MPDCHVNNFNKQALNTMKTLFITTAALIMLAGCTKQTACIGSDCVLPEAAIAIDSVTTNGIYVNLPNNEDGFYATTLQLAADINQDDFLEAASAYTTASPLPGNENEPLPMLKVYYIAEDQSYVRENARYIHASNTKFEIISYGNNLEVN